MNQVKKLQEVHLITLTDLITGRKKDSLFRSNGLNIKMSSSYLDILDAYNGINQDELKTIKSYKLKYDDPKLIESFIKKFKERNPSCNNLSDKEILDMVNIKSGPYRNLSCLLSFSNFPQYEFPNMKVIIYLKREAKAILYDEVDGSIWSMFNKSLYIIKKLIHFKLEINEDKVITYSDYPIKAIEEALFNALIHRNYSSTFINKPIIIYINKEELEITNPGEAIDFGIIASPIMKVPINHNLKRINEVLIDKSINDSGLESILNECKINGFKAPLIKSGNNEFSITFYKERIKGIFKNKKSIDSILKFLETPRTKEEIYHFLRPNGNAYPSDMIRKYIRPLLEMGFVKYTIPDKPKSKFQKIVACKLIE